LKIENTFEILEIRWRILINLNVDEKYIALVITAYCVLKIFCCMNLDIHCTSSAKMQDLHPNLKVNRGVPTQITFERPLSQKE
jgi:hypothetical protein